MELDFSHDDDFDRIADRLIIRCPICGKENKYPVEEWRDYGKDVVEE